eukprot:TRINITY_DN5958_c0_g1_i3.p1 TRINITY_DN5958_c0_g1~~TRINITY_DN5958_c0_g1_i3.p1  ORF type:complete len:1089 (+),score=297.77 TRINITY_DN5958_c0_g1_i3:161-3427(+)
MSDHKFFLKRSDSITSLASLGPDRRHSKKPAQGAVKLDVQFEAPPNLKAKKKTAGTLHVVVREAAGLATKEPYIKLYLSEKGKDLKGTKQKTKPSKKGADPLYEERFAYYLKPSMNLSETRLQVTLWDRSAMSSNTCIGGLSFAIDDVRDAPLAGWFQMMPEVEGRHSHELITTDDDLPPNLLAQAISAAAERGSTDSLASLGAGDDKKKRKSFRKGLGKLVRGKKGKQEAAEEKLAQDTLPASVLDAEDNFEDEASAFDRFAAPAGKTASDDNLDKDANDDEEDMDVDAEPEPEPEPEQIEPPPLAKAEPVVKRYSAADYDHDDNDDNESVSLTAAMATPVKRQVEEPSNLSSTMSPSSTQPEPVATEPIVAQHQDNEDDAWEDGMDIGSESESVPVPEPVVDKPRTQPSPPSASRQLPEPERGPYAITPDNKGPYAAESVVDEPAPHLEVQDRLPPTPALRRSNSSESITSLMSVTADQVVSSDNVSGELHLNLEYVEPSGRKPAGVRVQVLDASSFKAKSPYLKLYVSRNGVDVKSTKTKTKHGKVGKLPMPIELSVPLPKDVLTKAGSYRLQLSIWDHGRMKANECLGGMSFSLSDIMESARVEGHYELLPFQRGRCNNSKLPPPDRRSDLSAASNSMGGTTPQPLGGSLIGRRKSSASPVTPAMTAAVAATPIRAASPVNSTGSNDTGVSVSETKASGLRRSNSNGSLVSVASGMVTQSSTVQGALNVNIWFEPADENDVKFLGWLNITINEAQNLISAETYVKLYLLFRGKTVRSSKLKTKVVKKNKDPIFEQKLRMPVTRTQSIGADTVLELSVWDHSRLKANEVLGSVLFTMEDIASTTTTSGWYDLGNYNDGRKKLAGGASLSRRASGHGTTPAAAPTARLANMESAKSASREDINQVDDYGDAGPAADVGRGGRKKRTLPIGKTSKAQLNMQVEELRDQVRRLQSNEERHIQEKALLEEKLQSVRESTGSSSNLKKKNAEMMQELDDLRARTSDSAELHERVETLEDENYRLTQQLKLLNGDRERHTEEISILRDRVGDLTTEIRGLRAWKEVLADALLKHNPAALTQATVAIANSMN